MKSIVYKCIINVKFVEIGLKVIEIKWVVWLKWVISILKCINFVSLI